MPSKTFFFFSFFRERGGDGKREGEVCPVPERVGKMKRDKDKCVP
jgi:hypothetical protein